MQSPYNLTFAQSVHQQVHMLREGRPLEAFDRFFAADGTMYANDVLFAKGAQEGHEKQAPHILSAKKILGAIVDLQLSEAEETCVFRNQTSFETPDGTWHQIDGLCWQMWRGGLIYEERYYDGARMQALTSQGMGAVLERLRRQRPPVGNPPATGHKTGA